MKGHVHHRGAARRDLISVYRRYAREAGFRVAERFVASAEATFDQLAGMPEIGTRYEHNHPALADLRFLPLSPPFKRFLVFYRPVADGIEIARVLHGARDLRSILVEEFGIDGREGEDDATEA